MSAGQRRSAHEIGLRGERLVAQQAKAHGWRVQATRLRTAAGEADVFCVRDAVEGRVGLVIEVKTAEGQWPSTQLVNAARQAKLWRVAGLLAEQEDLAEVGVTVCLVRLLPDKEQVRWVALEAW
ncbi:MAG: YraN family protein [Myxococcales bacterium]|nr:YraN family protein [Myxococcales bacterium]